MKTLRRFVLVTWSNIGFHDAGDVLRRPLGLLNDSAVGRIKGPGGFGTLHHAAKISVGNDVPDRVLDGRLRSPLLGLLCSLLGQELLLL